LEELQVIISLLPEPAATAFAVAGFMGLRQGEIQGLLWENYRDGEIYVSRSIWNGRVTEPKTRKGRAPVPVIRQLAERLEKHRLRCGNSQSGRKSGTVVVVLERMPESVVLANETVSVVRRGLRARRQLQPWSSVKEGQLPQCLSTTSGGSFVVAWLG
jgi:hypothetical protein